MLNLLLTAALGAAPQGDVHYPPRPGQREFVLDEAKLLPDSMREQIRTLCDEVLTQKKAPIIVVTIESLASKGASGWPIERYAMNLMDEWEVGWPDWNYGMLLLVSPGDRKARIELGGSWERRKDDEAHRVLSERVIPRFKEGRFDQGILDGVRGLRAIALGLGHSPGQSAPAPPANGAPVSPPVSAPMSRAPTFDPSPGIGAGACAGLSLPVILGIVFLVVLLSRARGGGGVTSWGGGGPGPGYGGGPGWFGGGGGFGRGFGGGLLGGALGGMLYDSMRHRSSGGGFFGGGSSSSGSSGGGGGSGGSFGGGSFGGGFSGGGGATGSW